MQLYEIASAERAAGTSSLACIREPKALAVCTPVFWNSEPSLLRSKLGSEKKCEPVAAPCAAKAAPDCTPVCMNGIHWCSKKAPLLLACADFSSGALAGAESAELTTSRKAGAGGCSVAVLLCFHSA